MIKDFALFFWGSFLAFLSWFFGGFDGVFALLITLSVIDYLSGLTVGYLEDNLCSSVGFKGIARKCLMLSLVGIANLIDTYIPNGNIAVKSVVCIFYISNEGLSILENAYKLGVPIPKILAQHFKNMHDKLPS